MTAVADRAAPLPGLPAVSVPSARGRAEPPARGTADVSSRSMARRLLGTGVRAALALVGAAAANLAAEPRMIAALLAAVSVARPLGRGPEGRGADEAPREPSRAGDPGAPGAPVVETAGRAGPASATMPSVIGADALAPSVRRQDDAGTYAGSYDGNIVRAAATLCGPCDAAEAVAFAVRLLEAQAERAGVRVLYEIDAPIPPAACAQRDCRSAALSLVRHALRISGPGDTLRIRLRAVRGAVLLRVAAEARQDRHAALGALAAVRERAEANGGSLFVEAGPGCATVASLRLARADGPYAGGALADRRPPPSVVERRGE